MPSFGARELDALHELMNIAAGRAADAMSRLFGMRVYMHITRVRLLSGQKLSDFLTEEIGAIGSLASQRFYGGLDGAALMVVPYEHTLELVHLLTRGEVELLHLTSEDQSVLAELSNIVLSACVGSLVQQLGTRVRFQLPHVNLNLHGAQVVGHITRLVSNRCYQVMVLSTQLDLGEQRLETYILVVVLMDADELETLLRSLLSEME